MREIEGSAGARLPQQVDMKAIAPQRMVLPADRNRVPLAGGPTDPDEFQDDLEKYEHLEELAELFFAAKHHHPKVPVPAQP